MHKVRIGLLIENLDPYNTEVIRGAQAACDELGQELNIFYSSGLNQKTTLDSSSTHNVFSYEFANTTGVDLLLATTNSVARDMDNEEFLNKFNVPIISLGYVSKNHSSIIFDNHHGASNAVRFLIEEDKCSRIAIIAGPRGRTGSEERLASYKQTLEEHNIPFDEDLVLHCKDYSSHNSKQVGAFLDEHRDLDGIFCITDRLATCTYKQLKLRNYSIGHDISIVSFDDDPLSSSMVPPLSSVHADSAMMGYRAVIEGQHLLENNERFEVMLPTEFIPRGSVKKSSKEEDELYNFMNYVIKEKTSINTIAWGIVSYLYNNKVVFDHNLKNDTVMFYEVVLNAALHSGNAHDFRNAVDPVVDKVINEETIRFFDLDKLFTSFNILFDVSASKSLIQHNLLDYYIQYLYNRIGIIYSNITAMISRDAEERQTNITIANRLSLSLSHDSDTHTLMGETLSLLKIKNAAILTFDRPLVYKQRDKVFLPEYMNLSSLIINGEVKKTYNERYSQKQLLDLVQTNSTRTVSIIASGDTQYGLLMTDLTCDELPTLEYITAQLGTAFYVDSLIKKLQVQSYTDELTKVYNRRGLLKNITHDVACMSNDDKGYLVFMDMDGLKIINDTFGHEAGDTAIITATNIAKEVLNTNKLGRWGGDEFVAFIKNIDIEPFLISLDEKLKAASAKVDQQHHYPFKISLSYGLADISKNSTREEIAKTIEDADTKMYMRKRAKKNARPQ